MALPQGAHGLAGETGIYKDYSCAKAAIKKSVDGIAGTQCRKSLTGQGDRERRARKHFTELGPAE